MLNWLKNKSRDRPPEIRDTLFGDMPLAEFLPETTTHEPWASFRRALDFIDSRDPRGAIAVLQGVLEIPELESRHYLQAYYFLRELGVYPPPGKAKEVLGVIVEVGMLRGFDLVAAYADHRARYYNYSGAAVIWERPDSECDAAIDDMLKHGEAVVHAIGPWKDVRPPAPSCGQVRINLLARSGLYFGQGPLSSFAKDRLAGPVLDAAFQLMQQLIALNKR